MFLARLVKSGEFLWRIDSNRSTAPETAIWYRDNYYGYLLRHITGYGPSLTPQRLAEFLDKEGNILLLTAPSDTPEQAREFARQLEVELPPRGYLTVDHFNYDTHSSPKHDVVLLPRPVPSSSTGNYFLGGKDDLIAFRGTGHILGNRPLLIPVLSGSRTAYTYDAIEDDAHVEEAWAAGSQIHYVSALQTRSNARITVSGSVEMFSNEFFDMQVRAPGKSKSVKTANQKFAKEVTEWTFKETGIVKVLKSRHYLANMTTIEINPGAYRIKNNVVGAKNAQCYYSYADFSGKVFEIELTEYRAGRWIPFSIPNGDSLQLEFAMLDPYYRLPLFPISGTKESTIFSTTFSLPDQHGVFAFKVNYKRPYITFIEEHHSVTVRHFAHNEYTRSWNISGAWVWIAGILVSVVGWIGFCGLWLYNAPMKTP